MDAFTLVLLVMLGFGVLLIAGVGSQRRSGPLLPRLVAGGSIVLALLSVVGGIIGLVAAFATDSLTLPVPVIARVDVPPGELRIDDAEVVGGATQQATLLLTATGLDTVTRVLVAAEVVITTAVIVTLLVTVARFAQQSIAAEPFSPHLGRLLIIGGATLAVGSMAAQLVGQFAGQRAREQLFALSESAVEGVTNVPASWNIDLLPVGVGLALIVVAGLVRNGERLQRDTTGLV